MKTTIIEKIKSIDTPMDEAEAHFENKGRLIGSWSLFGITAVFAGLLLLFPDWFPLAAVGTALLMMSVLWAAEFFGRFFHSRRMYHLLSGIGYVAFALAGIWGIVESVTHTISKM